MKFEIPKELVDRILENAKREISRDVDGFNAYDYSGGNFDDAWEGGFNDGEISLSQELEEFLSNPLKE